MLWTNSDILKHVIDSLTRLFFASSIRFINTFR